MLFSKNERRTGYTTSDEPEKMIFAQPWSSITPSKSLDPLVTVLAVTYCLALSLSLATTDFIHYSSYQLLLSVTYIFTFTNCSSSCLSFYSIDLWVFIPSLIIPSTTLLCYLDSIQLLLIYTDLIDVLNDYNIQLILNFHAKLYIHSFAFFTYQNR